MTGASTLVTVLHTSLVWMGLIFGGAGAVYQFGIKPLRRLFRQTIEIHNVLLGTDAEADKPALPSLATRLTQGDNRMKRIEGELSSVVGSQQEVRRKVDKIEKTLDVLGNEDRLTIRRAIAAAAEPRARRQTDPPPPPPTPIRRQDGDV